MIQKGSSLIRHATDPEGKKLLRCPGANFEEASERKLASSKYLPA